MSNEILGAIQILILVEKICIKTSMQCCKCVERNWLNVRRSEKYFEPKFRDELSTQFFCRPFFPNFTDFFEAVEKGIAVYVSIFLRMYTQYSVIAHGEG
jgi:hypothetical protein